jgi:hypothetical protein
MLLVKMRLLDSEEDYVFPERIVPLDSEKTISDSEGNNSGTEREDQSFSSSSAKKSHLGGSGRKEGAIEICSSRGSSPTEFASSPESMLAFSPESEKGDTNSDKKPSPTKNLESGKKSHTKKESSAGTKKESSAGDSTQKKDKTADKASSKSSEASASKTESKPESKSESKKTETKTESKPPTAAITRGESKSGHRIDADLNFHTICKSRRMVEIEHLDPRKGYKESVGKKKSRKFSRN